MPAIRSSVLLGDNRHSQLALMVFFSYLWPGLWVSIRRVVHVDDQTDTFKLHINQQVSIQ